jgi:hypothetical protein
MSAVAAMLVGLMGIGGGGPTDTDRLKKEIRKAEADKKYSPLHKDVCTIQTETTCDLRDLWLNYNESHLLHRILDHADHYQAHLPPRHGEGKVKLLEIGIQSGGSTRAWRQWFGDRLMYVGIDVEPGCKRSESLAEDLHVEIGSQLDEKFLLSVCSKYGPFDVIIDDGAHRPEMIIKSLATLFPGNECMYEKGLYVIEDMQTMVMPKYAKAPRDMYDIVGEAFWSMHWHWAYVTKLTGLSAANYTDGQRKGLMQHPIYKNHVRALHAYDSITFIVRGNSTKPLEIHRGKDGIAYGKGHPMAQRVAGQAGRGELHAHQLAESGR